MDGDGETEERSSKTLASSKASRASQRSRPGVSPFHGLRVVPCKLTLDKPHIGIKLYETDTNPIIY